MNATPQAPFRLPEQPTKPEMISKYFRALGNPTRLAILQLLDQHELSVGEITQRVGLTQPQASNHLACLRWCGFVETRREHRTIYYRVAGPRVSQMLALAGSLLEDNEEHVAVCRTIDQG